MTTDTIFIRAVARSESNLRCSTAGYDVIEWPSIEMCPQDLLSFYIDYAMKFNQRNGSV